MPRTEGTAIDTGGIVHAVNIHNNDKREFVGLVWLCSGEWMGLSVEKFIVKDRAVTCALCLGTVREP